MGEQGKPPFRFLSDSEFAKLSPKDKAAYLATAAQELDIRQRKLREQMQLLSKEQQPKG